MSASRCRVGVWADSSWRSILLRAIAHRDWPRRAQSADMASPLARGLGRTTGRAQPLALLLEWVGHVDLGGSARAITGWNAITSPYHRRMEGLGCIGGMGTCGGGGLVRGVEEGRCRSEQGCAPCRCRGQCNGLGAHGCPGRPALRREAGRDEQWLRQTRHHACWGAPRAGASFGACAGSLKCSNIARTPAGAVKYAGTFRLPPHRAQANTSNAKVRRSNPAQSTRGLLTFFGSSTVAASAWLSSSGLGPGSVPTWGTRNGRSLAPGAKTPWNLVRFARGGGTKDATRRKSSSPVKRR